MGRPRLDDYTRYLRIAENTSKFKFETLITARNGLIRIATERGDPATLLETMDATQRLDKVINGTHDAKTYASAIRVSENVTASTQAEIIEARNVLRTISVDDLRYIEATKARRRLRASKLTG